MAKIVELEQKGYRQLVLDRPGFNLIYINKVNLVTKTII